jgi:hypothetical protein
VSAISRRPDYGIYVEFNFSNNFRSAPVQNRYDIYIGLVDDDGHGLMFYPCTGTVVKRTWHGSSICMGLLRPLSDDEPFQGTAGIYVMNNQIAFVRRVMVSATTELGPFEGTDYCSDAAWMESGAATFCVSLPDDASYMAYATRQLSGTSQSMRVPTPSVSRLASCSQNWIHVDNRLRARALSRGRLRRPSRPAAYHQLN